MKNIKGDIIWGIILLLWILLLIIPNTRMIFISITKSHPYIGGFIKFFILASMGDMLGYRIINNHWKFVQGFIYKALVWGCLGIMITLVFTVFMTGAAGAQAAGMLPFEGISVANALFGSIIMNATFGPMMYIYHKFGDLFVEMAYEKKKGIIDTITVKSMVDRVDWYSIVSFSWIKTCILVWMPCHTIVFLLPSEYRVLASAFLSILLGVLVALSKKGVKTHTIIAD